MGNRVIERRIARGLYDEFSRKWRAERRLTPTSSEAKKLGRKPTFGQWNRMHLRDLEMMRESTPADVQEYLGVDPWADGPTPQEQDDPVDRGVATVPIKGDQ